MNLPAISFIYSHSRIGLCRDVRVPELCVYESPSCVEEPWAIKPGSTIGAGGYTRLAKAAEARPSSPYINL